MKAAALMLSPEAPYPIQGGGALRTASLLHYLAHNYTVDLILFREALAPDPAAALPPGLVRQIRIIDLPHHSRSETARLIRNAARLARGIPPLVDRFSGFESRIADATRGRHYEVAIAEHFWCAPYAAQLSAVSDRTVLDLHNIESVLHAGCAATEPWPAAFGHRHFARVCRELEAKWLPRYSTLLAASEEDAQRAREISPGTSVVVYRNALPLTPVPPRADEFVVAFSGNLEYHPNQAAVRFFARRVWPILRERWPGLIWRLIGKNPGGVESYTRDDRCIELSGPVADAIDELARARVVVAPLLTGSGTRLKILEAWAAARPVVSTTIGAEGLSAHDGENILIADEPRQFANAVSRLLEDATLRQQLGNAGRADFERDFTWESAWRELNLQNT